MARRATGLQSSMTRYPEKSPFPVGQVRRYLEPGPIVLVSSSWRGRTNIMTMGSAYGDGIHAFARRMRYRRRQSQLSHDPEQRRMRHQSANDGLDRCGGGDRQHSGAEIDKFREFGLTAEKPRRSERL